MPDTSNLRDLSSPAHTELQNMLRGSLYVEDAPQAVVAYLTDLAKRAAERRGIAHAMVQVEIFADGTGAVAFGPEKRFGSYSEPLCDAVRAAEEWLSRDVVAEVNATLGLLPYGCVPPRLVVVDSRCDCGAPSDGRWADKHSLECASVKG